MSGILARIKFIHVKGAVINYLYEKEILDKNCITPTEFDPNETFFNVGDHITKKERQYTVVNIYTKFFNQTHQVHNYGTNLRRIGEKLPYNFEITYEVDDAEG